MKTVLENCAKYLSLAFLSATAWYLVFKLPYSFPPSQPVTSNSYEVGFSNTVAVLSVLILICLFYGWRVMFRSSVADVSSAFRSEVSESVDGDGRIGLEILALFAVVYAGLSLLIAHYIPYLDCYGESQYFVGRMDLLLRGIHPYRDVQFVYGPLFIYLPTAVARIGSVWGWSIEQSYVGFLLVTHIVGLGALYYFINQFKGNVRHKVMVFSLISLTFINYTLGLQYTLIRYFLPYALLFCLQSNFEKFRLEPARGVRKTSALAFSFALVALLLSPEVGLVYICAQAVFLWQARGRGWPLVATFLPVPICLVLFSPHYLMSVLAFGGGVANFPVVPSLFILFYLGTLFWMVPLLLRAAREEARTQVSALILGVVVLIIGFIPGALGRCDPGHVVWNGAAAMAVSLIVCGRLHFRKGSLYIAGYMAISVYLLGVDQLIHYKGNIDPVLSAIGGHPVYAEEKTPPLVAELKLAEYKSIMTPMGIDRDVERYLRKTGQYQPAYYNDMIVMATPRQVVKEIQALQKAQVILVPANIMQFKNGKQVEAYLMSEGFWRSQESSQRSFLSGLHLMPVDYRIVRTPYSAYCELAKYIAANFTPVRSGGGYMLMTPNPYVYTPDR